MHEEVKVLKSTRVKGKGKQANLYDLFLGQLKVSEWNDLT